MTANEANRWLMRMVKQRIMLTNSHKGNKNELLMLRIAEKVKRQLEGYPPKGDRIFEYIRRNYVDILIIIPGNSSREKNFNTLKNIVCATDTKKVKECSRSRRNQPLSMQLSCF